MSGVRGERGTGNKKLDWIHAGSTGHMAWLAFFVLGFVCPFAVWQASVSLGGCDWIEHLVYPTEFCVWEEPVYFG